MSEEDPDPSEMPGQIVQGGATLWAHNVAQSLFSVLVALFGERSWIRDMREIFIICFTPVWVLYDELRDGYNALSPAIRFIFNSSVVTLFGCSMWMLYLFLELNLDSTNIAHLFRLEKGVMFLTTWVSSKKMTTNNLEMCMLLCKKEPSCYGGFFDYSLEGDNCFLFSSPPAYYGHSPISSPTATTFIKRKKLEVPGAKYEMAEEDNLYYYTSPDPMSYHEMVDYCSNGNKFYHPAIMGLNNSAYAVALRHYRRILQEGHQERKHGLLFLMAIGTPDSDSQYDLARGFAIKGHDSSSRDRLVRFIFYKYDMLEFLTDRDSSQQFFVLCQGDPLNLQDYNRLARSLFLRPV